MVWGCTGSLYESGDSFSVKPNCLLDLFLYWVENSFLSSNPGLVTLFAVTSLVKISESCSVSMVLRKQLSFQLLACGGFVLGSLHW